MFKCISYYLPTFFKHIVSPGKQVGLGFLNNVQKHCTFGGRLLPLLLKYHDALQKSWIVPILLKTGDPQALFPSLSENVVSFEILIFSQVKCSFSTFCEPFGKHSPHNVNFTIFEQKRG